MASVLLSSSPGLHQESVPEERLKQAPDRSGPPTVHRLCDLGQGAIPLTRLSLGFFIN